MSRRSGPRHQESGIHGFENVHGVERANSKPLLIELVRTARKLA